MSNQEELPKPKALEDENSAECAQNTEYINPSSAVSSAKKPESEPEGTRCKLPDGRLGEIDNQGRCVAVAENTEYTNPSSWVSSPEAAEIEPEGTPCKLSNGKNGIVNAQGTCVAVAGQ